MYKTPTILNKAGYEVKSKKTFRDESKMKRKV